MLKSRTLYLVSILSIGEVWSVNEVNQDMGDSSLWGQFREELSLRFKISRTLGESYSRIRKWSNAFGCGFCTVVCRSIRRPGGLLTADHPNLKDTHELPRLRNRGICRSHPDRSPCYRRGIRHLALAKQC